MVEQKISESRSRAQRLIMAGEVLINGQQAKKSSDLVSDHDQVTVKKPAKYVSRGGEKLEAALVAFDLQDLHGKVCADVGSATGGFSDCLLQMGAEKVYAIDVGYGLLHWKLRNNPRIVLMEKTNARNIKELPEKVHLCTIDASFISLKTLLPCVKKWITPQGVIIALIKPQFEAGRELVARGKGVIRDTDVHKKVINEITRFAEKVGLKKDAIIQSPIIGPKGNKEFFIHLTIKED